MLCHATCKLLLMYLDEALKEDARTVDMARKLCGITARYGPGRSP
jgi:hypothetical protein